MTETRAIAAAALLSLGFGMTGACSGSPAEHAREAQAPATAAAHASQQAATPAPGGTAIADIWANRKSLAGKTVTVRGKVVRFNGGILGRNWIHVQDGTGVAAKGTHDILVTSDATAKIGDTVTATGTVALDKDFTAGYVYPVMIEGATVILK